MTDKKLSDNEIIKALEYCEDSRDTDKHCLKCPYCNESYCLDKMMADALSLINRQKAEVSELQRRNSELQIELKAMRGAANSYKAEVERLGKAVDNYEDCLEKIETIKAEAIKEFAERLKEALYRTEFGTPVVDVADIDNLVKEMVGEEDG